ncbi:MULTISPECIES: esterase-like activity of phytase family protein [unclassified Chelatococcus]|uniref:esterase-like activity of phytase family protein n=1 Tax=unclassified Chelatococcus TaxID=2638111 RepID=UPI001BD0897C|nr:MULTISPECIES: esterase-like activity of phytase family protein [unclassified Chelatococcus]MBS7695989.1 esterase-like activity of phytase family protein [Chelatococcus sp. YT9]MBX3555636.1 esterase-like activity of phytase family protein [Chelatococcus sp.]
MIARLLLAMPLTAVLAGTALAQQAAPATLAGHAILPAKSFVEAPADAPADLRTSGKFTTGKRVEAVNTVEGLSNGRPTGMKVPFTGQPLQGHSGIKKMTDGTFWVLTDNGMGAKANSPDSMLYLNHYRIDWDKGTVERLGTVFLSDPDKKVPFRIANEATDKRYLTGSDFDPESFQIIGDKIWIGEEFGPYLIRADMTGKVEAVIETMVDGKPARSPDHYAVTTPAAPNQPVPFNVRRSKGYEGMAASKDGRFLYPLLEGPLWDVEKKDWEKTADGKEYLRILEFDVAAEKWTGRHWKFVLEQNGNAIGDFNMIDPTMGLIIERDNGEGTADKACPEGQKRADCFADIAKFKRVYKVELSDANANGVARKVAYIDLMKIADPNKKARKPLNGDVLTFPFFTIEDVDLVDDRHIIVGNDNNLPFSTSREPNVQDDNEFVLLEVADFLKAR